MFEQFEMAPPDPILGLNDAFRKDPNPHKINLGVGEFKDAHGATPILQCVKEAERRLLAEESSKGYLGIDGSPEYGRCVRELLFGAGHEILTSQRAATVQTPGGTGALRVAADLVARKFPTARVWFSQPTWPNHPSVFQAAGLKAETYPYFDAARNGLDFAGMLERLGQAGKGDVVCLHACCHNPTGVDPTAEQWREIGHVLRERGALPLVDFAYHGFGDGLEADAGGLRELCGQVRELLICSSFSKNFGLYGERVGALTLVAESADAVAATLSHAKICVRVNYSNPPKHGAVIVATVLSDPGLRRLWEQELAEMRNRINGMRDLFVATLLAKGVQRDFSFIRRQRGMFSFSGLTQMQVDELKKKHAIYIVGNGRINVAGMTEAGMDRLCEAIKSVL